MDEPQRSVGEQVARAARAFERRRTARGRAWVAVFLSEDTMTIALHGSLTAAEMALGRTPAGAARVRERHGRLFAAGTGALCRRIKAVAGLDVRNAAAEVDLTAGHVVHVLTTDTSVEEFVRYESEAKSGEFLVVAHGKAAKDARSKTVIGTPGATETHAHHDGTTVAARP